MDPRSIFRAKAAYQASSIEQTTFVEAGLLDMVEGEVSDHLCQLIENMVFTTARRLDLGAVKELGESDAQWLVKANFWLLAARLLQDKEVYGFKTLNFDDIENVFSRVGKHYGTPMQNPLSQRRKKALCAAAAQLSNFSSLRLVSTEALARVYENVLVTKETRKALGTHSTPAWLVDYMIESLTPWIEGQSPDERRVFEPASGHAPFLVSLLRKFSSMSPCREMQDTDRHEWLKARLHGAEIDDFAREVARLSLTLADIPNGNGWHILEGDMFTNGSLEQQIKKANIIVSNPPFEARDGGPDDRLKMGQDVELLRQIDLHAEPGTLLAYVMRQTILDSPKHLELRKSLLKNFEWLEILRLPDKVFEKADVETVVLFGRKTSRKESNLIRFRHVWDGQVQSFQNTGFVKVDQTRLQEQLEGDKDARMLVPDLADLWEHLDSSATLEDIVSIGRGFEYRSETDPLYPKGKPKISECPKDGYEPGFYNMRNPVLSHLIPPINYMLADESAIRRPMLGVATEIPRVVMNHAPASRGAWLNIAYLDRGGHFTRSAFLVIEPKTSRKILPLTIWAILNSPVSNAFARSFSKKRHILGNVVSKIPVPHFHQSSLKRIEKAAESYRNAAAKLNITHAPKASDLTESRQAQLPLSDAKTDNLPSKQSLERLKYLHWKMDAAVLAAYDLPPLLERQLLDFFDGQKRVGVPFEQIEYFPAGFEGAYTLSELIAITGDWSKTNRKRLKLIDREYEEELSENETQELTRLQNLATLRRRLVDPYPIAELDAKIEQMKREGKWTE